MRSPLIVVSAFGLLVAGCANPPAKTIARPASQPATATAPAAAVMLAKGMPTTQVRALLGEPSERKPMKTASGGGEIWIYRRPFEEFAGSLPAGTEAVTEFGPFDSTGARTSTVTQRPAFKDQYRKAEETIMILIIADQVVEWDRTLQKGPVYTR